jgi:hypothetical protein
MRSNHARLIRPGAPFLLLNRMNIDCHHFAPKL